MKKRTLRKIRFLCLVMLLVSAVTFTYNKFTTDTTTVTREFTYVVESKDTLWDIATAHNFNNEDVRKLIYDIQQYNDIGATIYPGQSIIIPVKVAMKNDNGYKIASSN